MEIEGLMQPKPILNSNSKMAEQYNKMREISEKYSKLPLKPGFSNGNTRAIKLNHLSIDVNANDYNSALLQSNGNNSTSQAQGNISNRSTNNHTALSGMKSV